MNVSMSNNNLPIEEPGEDFPDPSDLEWGLSQDSPGSIQPEPEVSSSEPDIKGAASSFDVLLSLGLGVLLLGFDQVNNRLQAKRSMVETPSQHDEPFEHPDDEQNQLRYALIGMLIDTPRVVRQRARRGMKLANAAFTGVSELFRPLAGSRAFRPVSRRFDRMVARGERVVSDWIDAGRRGEVNSRVLLQQTSNEVVSELVGELAHRPEVTELVQQQSIGMVEELSDELQGRTAAIDTILERIVFRLIPGTKKDTTPTMIIPVPEEEQEGGLKKQSSRGEP